MPAIAAQRIEAISKQLRDSPNPPATATTMSADKRPPITCHVLDTTLGRPAANIPVTLTLYSTTSASSPTPSTSPVKFSATTNSDGRVTSWTASGPFASQSLEEVYHLEGDHKWSLLFDTDEYFAERAKTFFPEVEVKFRIRQEAKGEHYHVPVLLGPFGYTTYRGS